MMLAVSLFLAFSPLTALQQALGSSAEWEMSRTLPGSTRALVSSGTVDCQVGSGIVWTVTRPFPSSVTMSPDAMVFVDEDGRREKKLDELPHYADIRKATDAFAAGDARAFDGVFALREERFPDGGWKLELTPEVSAMTRLVKRVEIFGAALPTNVVLTAGDGGQSEIRFKERPRVR